MIHPWLHSSHAGWQYDWPLQHAVQSHADPHHVMEEWCDSHTIVDKEARVLVLLALQMHMHCAGDPWL